MPARRKPPKQAPPKRRGRPPNAEPRVALVPVGARIAPELRDQVDRFASGTGRTRSAAVEHLLAAGLAGERRPR